MPHVQYPSANGVMRLRQQTFTIRRLGDPQPDDLTRPLQGMYVYGITSLCFLSDAASLMTLFDH